MGDQILGDQILGTICPWGPNLMGTVGQGGSILWGLFAQGDRKWGTGSLGIKWVQDQMSRSLGNRNRWPGKEKDCPKRGAHGPTGPQIVPLALCLLSE